MGVMSLRKFCRCLEPGNNALIQETTLFSVQLLAARDRR